MKILKIDVKHWCRGAFNCRGNHCALGFYDKACETRRLPVIPVGARSTIIEINDDQSGQARRNNLQSMFNKYGIKLQFVKG